MRGTKRQHVQRFKTNPFKDAPSTCHLNPLAGFSVSCKGYVRLTIIAVKVWLSGVGRESHGMGKSTS
eukprot:2890127-Amphidinium_carterae.1